VDLELGNYNYEMHKGVVKLKEQKEALHDIAACFKWQYLEF